ncbi:MAG: hypothetical protein U9R08_02940 [Nanoarchaeota archaeon]|nr:hypothetical protein [Nanoarchaeota archaeon]
MNLYNTKTAVLRKLAESKGIEGWESLERIPLIKALSKPVETKIEETTNKPKEEKKLTPLEKLKNKYNIPTKEFSLAVNSALKLQSKDLPDNWKEQDGIFVHKYPVGSKKAEIMDKELKSQPLKQVYIPREIGDRGDTVKTVTLNGYKVDIRKGIYAYVPEQIATVIFNSEKQTTQAFADAKAKHSRFSDE